MTSSGVMRVIESLNPIGATEEVFFSVTSAMLTATNVPETAPSAYNAGTTYGDGALVSVSASGNAFDVYESLQAGNTGNTPASSPLFWKLLSRTYGVYAAGTYADGDRAIDATTHLQYLSLAGSNTAALSDATKWRLEGPTNRWRMFDLKRNQVTTVASPLIVEITPGKRVDAVGLTGLVADEVTIEVIVGGHVQETFTASLSTRNTTTWSQYFFGEFTFKDRYSRFDLPPYSSATIRITLTRDGGSVSCGRMVVNKHVFLGEVEAEPEDDALNFSSVTREFDGTSTLIPRRSAQKVACRVWCDKENVPAARALRNRLPATPAFWSGLDDASSGYYDSMTILGFFTRFKIGLDHPDNAPIDLEIEEA